MHTKTSIFGIQKIIYIFLWYILTLQISFADSWIFWGLTELEIRRWEIHTDDIPWIIKWAIDFFINIAWSIAIIFIIIWAYKILFGSLEQDKTKWKDTIIMALGWFVIASLAWFIVKIIIDNLS